MLNIDFYCKEYFEHCMSLGKENTLGYFFLFLFLLHV